ncbi:MAG: MotA/TolQ/ExbB proton channel family protein [Verrucomicrobiota bacterium]|nr:MotA/TolQ/ExbB proton channel family protein [Verrucomicrobiota bacterium]
MKIGPDVGKFKTGNVRLKDQIVFGVALAVCIGGIISSTLGQDAAKAPAPAAAPAKAATPAPEAPAPPANKTLLDYWNVGGWCMYPIGLLSVGMVALTVYGFLLTNEKKMLTPHLVGPLTDALKSLRIDDAISMCTTTPSLLTNILHSGLQRIRDGVLDVAGMDKAMEESSVEETAQGLRMISYLSVVGQTAPMWGLLGTVSGMIKAFDKIGMGGMGKPELLAADIGEAMITTFAGLVVGIPSMVFYFYLKSRYSENLTRLGRVLGNLSHELVATSRQAAEDGLEPAGPAAAQPAP